MQVDMEPAGPLRVVADQRLMGDVLARALTSRGVPASVEEWEDQAGPRAARTSADGGAPPIGALLCTVDDGLSLASALAFLRASPVRWVVAVPGPPDGRWEALLEAGACEVVDTAADVDEFLNAVQGVASGRPRSDVAPPEGFHQWARTHPREAQVLAGLEHLDPAERAFVRGLLGVRTDPAPRQAPHDEVVSSGDGDLLEPVLDRLGLEDGVAVVAAVRALDASPLFPGAGAGSDVGGDLPL